MISSSDNKILSHNISSSDLFMLSQPHIHRTVYGQVMYGIERNRHRHIRQAQMFPVLLSNTFFINELLKKLVPPQRRHCYSTHTW